MRRTGVAFALAFLMSVPAFAQMPPGHGHGHGQEYGQGYERQAQGEDHGDMEAMGHMAQMCLEHAEDLGLSDDQVRKISVIHRDMLKKHIRFKADSKIAKIDLMDILETKDFDLDKATAAVKKLSDMKSAHHIDMLRSLREIRSNLNEEQYQAMSRMSPCQ